MSRSAAVVKRVQYAALPYRLMGRSGTEVMLVTSRDTRRWIIPKGWPQKGRAPHHSAAREAFEEAGVEGVIDSRPVGTFPYQKRLKNGGVVDCEVEVYALRVLRQSKRWAGKRRAPGQVGVRAGSSRNSAGAQAEHDHPPLGAEVGRLRQALAARAFARPVAGSQQGFIPAARPARTHRAAAAIHAAAAGRDRRRYPTPPADARRGRAPGDDGDRSRASHPARRVRA